MSHESGKLDTLKDILRDLGGVVVAYSGGVDSTFLVKVCQNVLKEKVLAVTANSPTYPARELSLAREMAGSLSVRHLVIATEELEDPDFAANPPDRCYHCKLELFGQLKQIAAEERLGSVVDGANHDDLSDHRPGMRAAAEVGVRHPLQEAALSKEEIRTLSREMGLPTWDKPSLACLASRFPYGTRITKDALSRVNDAEEFLQRLGIGQLRVRHYETTARIEVEPQDMHILLDAQNRQRIVSRLRELGYSHVTLDLAGYRSGSMNEGLSL